MDARTGGNTVGIEENRQSKSIRTAEAKVKATLIQNLACHEDMLWYQYLLKKGRKIMAEPKRTAKAEAQKNKALLQKKQVEAHSKVQKVKHMMNRPKPRLKGEGNA